MIETTFSEIIGILNSKKTGERLTRQELTSYFYGRSMATIDTYRRKLLVAGFLTEFTKGVYVRTDKVLNYNYTTTQLRRDYTGNLEQWYQDNPMDEVTNEPLAWKMNRKL